MPKGIESLDTSQHQVGGDRPDVPRPLPPRRVVERLRSWVAWFGVVRMLALGATVLFVGAGGYWLLHAPQPPVEASLPFATTTPTTPVGGGPGAGGEAVEPAVHATMVPGTTTPAAPPAPTLVHVAGAVAAPGVYELPAGSRVVNAIEAAGGPAPSAALDGLNLAATVADGQRVYVPVVGEVDPASVDNGPAAPAAGPGESVPSGAATAPIDLNRALAADLETLPGVGPATAASIIEDRQRNGPFATVDDLDRVSGIGPATLERLRELVTV